ARLFGKRLAASWHENRIIWIRPKTKTRCACARLCTKHGAPAGIVRNVSFIARKTGLENRLANGQKRRRLHLPSLRHIAPLWSTPRNHGNRAAPAVVPPFQRANFYILPK